MHDPDPPKDQQPSPPTEPRRADPLRWIRDHPAETGAICAALAVIISVFSLLLQGVKDIGLGLKDATSESDGISAARPHLTVIGKVKQSGKRTWSDHLEMANGGGWIVYGLRVENSGQKTVDNLVARADLPEHVTAAPGSCWYGIDRVAATPCPAMPVTEGVRFAKLEPGSWFHLVFTAAVSPRFRGGRYRAMLTVSSDQTDEIHREVEVKVPATAAEDAVRGLYRATGAEANGFWDGAPVMAPRSKRFLIERWAELGLERSHRFDRLPRGPLVSLSRLHHDHRLEGRVVELKASIIGPPSEFSLGPGLVKQKLEVGVAGEPERAWCYTVRSAERLLRYGDNLEIKGVPIAWGAVDGARKAAEATMMACPAIHLLRAR